MRTRIPYALYRIGLIGVLFMAATLMPPRPAASCMDDQTCANNCGLACEQSWEVPHYNWDAYYQCMNQCMPSCSTGC